MSFRFDQCTQDAHMLAETCRIFAETLDPEERQDFYSALLNDLADNRDVATHPRGLGGYEPVTTLAHDMGATPLQDTCLMER